MHYYVQGTRQLTQPLTHSRAQTAPDAVTFHCSTQGLAYGKPYTRTSLIFAGTIKSCEVAGEVLFPLLVDRLKVLVPQ